MADAFAAFLSKQLRDSCKIMQCITTLAPTRQVFAMAGLDVNLQCKSSSTVSSTTGLPGNVRPPSKPSHAKKALHVVPGLRQ
jgi:hypothetical protein